MICKRHSYKCSKLQLWGLSIVVKAKLTLTMFTTYISFSEHCLIVDDIYTHLQSQSASQNCGQIVVVDLWFQVFVRVS